VKQVIRSTGESVRGALASLRLGVRQPVADNTAVVPPIGRPLRLGGAGWLNTWQQTQDALVRNASFSHSTED
jgi:hypothetical protein